MGEGEQDVKRSIQTRRQFLERALGGGAGLSGVLTPRGRARSGRFETQKRFLRWQAHTVAQIPHGYQVAVADVNGDGKLDILALSSQENIVEWYESPTWRAHLITSRTQKNISLAPLLRAGAGISGLALASDFSLQDTTHGGNVWWLMAGESPDAEWSTFLIGQIPTSHRLRWANLAGDCRLRLVDAPIVGASAKPPEYSVGAPLTWFEQPQPTFGHDARLSKEHGASWKPHLIDETLTVVHGLRIVDWDGDGRDELLTASFEGVHLFHSKGHAPDLRWTKVRLAAGSLAGKGSSTRGSGASLRRGSSEIAVGTLGRRRFLATIEPWHGEEVVVYFERERGRRWDRYVIDSSFRDGHALACADLDGDGKDEIVAGFRGSGTSLFVYYAVDSSGIHWQRQTLDTEIAASGIAIEDINGDGRLDVVAIGASTGNVNWYENLG